MERLTGVAGVAVAGEGPAAVDRAKGDPSSLRRMLRTAGVVDLVARSRASHPTGEPAAASAAAEPIIDDREPAPVVILPVAASVDEDGLVQVPEAEQGSTDATADDDDHQRSGAAVLAAGTAAAVAASVATGGVAAASERPPARPEQGPKAITAGAAGALHGLDRRRNGRRRNGGRRSSGRRPERAQSPAGQRRVGRRRRGGRAGVRAGTGRCTGAGGRRAGRDHHHPDPERTLAARDGPNSGTNNGPGGDDGPDGNGTGGEPGGFGTFYPIQPFAAAAIPLNAIFPVNDGPPDLSVDPTIVNPGTNGGPNDVHDPDHGGHANHGNKHHGGPKHTHGTTTHKHADRTPGPQWRAQPARRTSRAQRQRARPRRGAQQRRRQRHGNGTVTAGRHDGHGHGNGHGQATATASGSHEHGHGS